LKINVVVAVPGPPPVVAWMTAKVSQKAVDGFVTIRKKVVASARQHDRAQAHGALGTSSAAASSIDFRDRLQAGKKEQKL